ncbi:LysR family transcriptional regulator [Planotetraspora kaengkrachanensis]|uniref:LysR family transcriptional regulator n=1 Tax=Planotetraspora kaengkrachanensis TaxID=575193 RepID=A0A8J3VCT3_9ACTN|nr:LysR family transcriptional regulator [Planotetraspora kaengkrachanensis]GIG85047.1 LysR family transcriptional regulator [Planotetraspora kaengkrachanensis]
MDSGPPLRDIGCFALVARHLSFSRAAAELGVSQPAVSQAIGRLERSLGVRLFDRTSRDVRLSHTGKALLPDAEALLQAAARFSAEAARLAVPAGPTIRLAYPSLVGTLAARVARRLAHRRPAIEVELLASGRSDSLTALAQGEVTAAIVQTPFPLGFTTAARFHVPVAHLAVPAGHPLASKSRLRLGQLARQRIVVPRNRPPGGMWARIAALLPGPDQLHVVAGDLDDFASALDLVAAGAGLLPTPSLLVGSIRRHDVHFVPLESAELRMTFGLTWAGERASPELMALVQATQECLWTR